MRQMENALRLPSAVRGALMPDAHLGYGLPIGGVLATEDTVIPYAVGVDIACRMKLSRPRRAGRDDRRRGRRGSSARSCARRSSAPARSCREARPTTTCWTRTWSVTPPHARPARARPPGSSARAARATTSSSSGAHAPQPDLGLEPAATWRCSRTPARAARARRSPATTRSSRASCTRSCRGAHAPRWLDLDSEAGQEYWAAMNLMGDYAAANHEVIHRASRAHCRPRSSPASRTTTTSPGRSGTAAAT